LIESNPVQFLGWPQGLSFQEMTREKALAFKEECQQKKASPILGEWEENQVIKKSGKFGEYVQCGEYSIPYQEGESIEKIIERLEEKKRTKQSEKAFEGYSIRTGPYGPYIVKTSLKTPQFVSLPKGIQIDTLTQKEVEYLYKTGLQSKLEAKKSWKKKNETK
jgi:topoisomerase IA-like protein